VGKTARCPATGHFTVQKRDSKHMGDTELRGTVSLDNTEPRECRA